MNDSASPQADLSGMKIVRGVPPNFDAIDAVFQVREKMRKRAVFFCYGKIIYNPSGIKIPTQIMVHEATHCVQQGDDPAGWWEQYLTDLDFRFSQEVQAHRNEYRQATLNDPNRHGRRFHQREIAKRLSSALYGHMVTFDGARRLLVQEAA